MSLVVGHSPVERFCYNFFDVTHTSIGSYKGQANFC